MSDWCSTIPGVEDVFGSQSRQLRVLQHDLLTLFDEHGYDEVIPPLLERPEVLLAGAGRFLMNNTLVFNDPEGHGQLALRSDMTPQIARIAATRLQQRSPLKLCYSGSVVQARADGMNARRQQWQTGIEYLGVAETECDLEVLQLAALSMLKAGFCRPILQLGHVGIIQALCADSRHDFADWVQLLQHRSSDDVQHLLADDCLPAAQSNALLELTDMQADARWLQRHREQLGAHFTKTVDSLMRIEQQAKKVLAEDVDILVDAALMPHFLYHTGLIFRGYTPAAHCAVLSGGRYDDMMAAHGRVMPAVGFSFDLQQWLQYQLEGRSHG